MVLLKLLKLQPMSGRCLGFFKCVLMISLSSCGELEGAVHQLGYTPPSPLLFVIRGNVLLSPGNVLSVCWVSTPVRNIRTFGVLEVPSFNLESTLNGLRLRIEEYME